MLKKNKKGISAVVATVLIILITVAGVTIVWTAIIPMIKTNLELGTACLDADVFIDISSGYTCYDADKKQSNVIVKKRAGDFELVGIQIGLASEGDVESYEIRQGDPPILYMPFEEGFGYTTKDLSSNRYNGTIYNASWIGGKFGEALSFDGTGDYIGIVENPVILNVDVDEVRTIEAWFKGGTQNDHGNILWKEGCCKGWSIRLYNSGNVRLGFNTGESGCCVGMSWYSVTASDATYNDNQWHHVIGVIDRPNNRLELYIDGQSKGTDTPDNIKEGEGGTARVGTNWNNGRPFNGSIDEVRIFSRALSAEEIKKIYESSKAGKQLFYGELPNTNEGRTYMLTGKNITEARVAPIVRIGNRERVCDVTSKVQMPRCA